MYVLRVLGTEPVVPGSADRVFGAGTRRAPEQPPSTERTHDRWQSDDRTAE